MTGNAIKMAEGFEINLDYSDESIQKVEEILAKINAHFINAQSDEGLSGIAFGFAGYIVTVIEKNHGAGKWEKDHKEAGADTFPFHWKGGTIFPYAWCMKRIIDGDSDNVWFKYQALVLKTPDNGSSAG